MKYDKIHHHGDIVFKRIANPESEIKALEEKQSGDVIVGHGESSGHQHVVEGGTLLARPTVTMEMLHEFAMTGEAIPGGVYIYSNQEETPVRHLFLGETPTGDHDDIALEPGLWEVTRPRQYDPSVARGWAINGD